MFTSLKKMILQNRKRRVREKNRALVRFFLFLLETKSNVIRICTNERMVVYVFCDDINCFFIRSLSRNSDCRGGYSTCYWLCNCMGCSCHSCNCTHRSYGDNPIKSSSNHCDFLNLFHMDSYTWMGYSSMYRNSLLH